MVRSVTSDAAEGVVVILDRYFEFSAAPRIAAPMPENFWTRIGLTGREHVAFPFAWRWKSAQTKRAARAAALSAVSRW
jgi:hypothetical protein